ncbi:hypothetical protein TRVL_10249 [Trypanosoma vivax]|nr:hypothetical protein TRVL_10249 [Trypanosoma vivax]
MSDDECPELVSARVPVTILTGFLGSGKTTLLHYVLSAEHSLRIAVIVNEFEFGKSIEKGLTLKSSQKPDDEWLELNNGCMCCTAQTQTVKALEGLMQSKGTFDLVLVETSGLADPAPVAGHVLARRVPMRISVSLWHHHCRGCKKPLQLSERPRRVSGGNAPGTYGRSCCAQQV